MLDTMVELASDRITMLVVSHEMGFARQVADRMIFMADGQILEINEPKSFSTIRNMSARGFSCSKFCAERCKKFKTARAEIGVGYSQSAPSLPMPEMYE